MLRLNIGIIGLFFSRQLCRKRLGDWRNGTEATDRRRIYLESTGLCIIFVCPLEANMAHGPR